MSASESSAAVLDRLERATYYEILGIAPDSEQGELQVAFHEFALTYHPDRHVNGDPGTTAVVTAVFKRGTEAFFVLSDAERRRVYDGGLKKGYRRFAEAARDAATPSEAPRAVTLEELASTPKAKALARRADRCVIAGEFEKARIFVIDALQDDPENVELRARLGELYTAGGTERL